MSQVMTAMEANLAKWTLEQKVVLIRLIKAKSHLWDMSSPLYEHKRLKRTSYKEVAEQLRCAFPETSLHITYDSVIATFLHLCKCHVRQRVQAEANTSSPSNDEECPFHADLENMLNLERTTTLVFMEDLQSILQQDGLRTPSKKKKKKYGDEMVTSAVEVLRRFSASQMDEDDAYGRYVAKKLKYIRDPLKKESCRIEIQRTIMKYAFNAV